MSVANLFFSPLRIQLVTDTVSYRGKRPVRFGRKATIIPRAHVAMTMRGLAAVGDDLADLSRSFVNFESAISLIATYADMSPLALFSMPAEITVLGWSNGSPVASRILVRAAENTTQIERFDLKPGVYLAPSLGKHDIPAELSEQQLLKIAVLQQDMALRHGLNLCVGGDIELVELDAEGVTIRKIGEYPNKAKTVADIQRLEASITSRGAA